MRPIIFFVNFVTFCSRSPVRSALSIGSAPGLKSDLRLRLLAAHERHVFHAIWSADGGPYGSHHEHAYRRRTVVRHHSLLERA